jgi:AbiV family abortive infection protein
MMLKEVNEHLKRYWQISREFYISEDFALASFFSITLIEECGKVVIMANQKLGKEIDIRGFYDHREKYIFAVRETLLVNSRVSRIYGQQEKMFAKWFTDNELFKIRNRALYLGLGKESIITPKNAIRKNEAYLLVCFAGEIFGELQGAYTDSSADEWLQVISEIDIFRSENSL